MTFYVTLGRQNSGGSSLFALPPVCMHPENSGLDSHQVNWRLKGVFLQAGLLIPI
jgi:hypothetical protein